MPVESASLEQIRNRAFNTIGRLVVLLQRSERALKWLVAVRSIQGTPETIGDAYHERWREVERLTLGQVVGRFFDGEGDNGVERLAAAGDDSPYLSHRLDLGETTDAEWRRHCETVVAERNELIHAQLANVDWTSHDACSELLERLEQQRDRVLQLHDSLYAIRDELRDVFEELAEPDAFLQHWEMAKDSEGSDPD